MSINQKYPRITEPSDRQRPAQFIASCTASDTVDLGRPARAIYVGGAGNVRIMTPGSTVATLASVQAGTVLPIEVIRVFSSGTTATNIIGLS